MRNAVKKKQKDIGLKIAYFLKSHLRQLVRVDEIIRFGETRLKVIQLFHQILWKVIEGEWQHPLD